MTTDSNRDIRLEQAVNAMPNSSKLDKDIVVYWRLADNLPGAVEMITYKCPASTILSGLTTITMAG